MNDIFELVNRSFEFIVPAADFLWDFPTNFEWYSNIPILGKFTFAIILLLGSGIYFTFKTGFVQIFHFKKGLKIMLNKKASEKGVSPLASFMLSSATRVGAGNIMGVTGAISVGGPGALFWMWFSAFFGMSIAFAEAVLAQIYKVDTGKEYVGGLPFYGQKILGDKRWVGVILSFVFVVYALFSVPGQVFHIFTALGSVADTLAGTTFERQSMVYYIIALSLITLITLVVFGGIKGVTKVSDVLVPIMAIVYIITALLLVFFNLNEIPYFFSSVLKGAFTPEAVFGGGFGIALAQGIKRGLMSNEAGQGTITMAAAIAENDHPCEQGFLQVIGVFLDTIVICTLSGFIVILAHIWDGNAGVVWADISSSKITVFMTSVKYLVPGTSMDNIVTIILSLCYALFAFTSLIGLICFAEISANLISTKRSFINGVRFTGALILAPFGALTVLSGLELGNLWYISDFVNIMVVYANVPIVLLAQKQVIAALKHYNETNGKERFVSKDIGIETDFWTEKNKNEAIKVS